jgi:hypothetical protein
MHRWLLSWLSLFLLTAAAVAQYGSNSQANALPDSQLNSQPTVKLGGRILSDLYSAQSRSNFCRLVCEGARLQARDWERFGALHILALDEKAFSPPLCLIRKETS